MKRKCVVCEFICLNTAAYNTTHGVVCEECFESASGVKSNYEDWLTYNSPKAAKKEIERLEKESAELKEELQAKTDLLGLVIAEKAGLEQENSELRNHLNNLIKESTGLTEFKNDTLRRGICSTDLDEPEWHDYQTIGEAAEYLGKLLNK